MSSVGRLCGVRGDPGEDCSLVRPDLAGNSRHGVVVVGTSPADFLKCTMTFFQSISIYVLTWYCYHSSAYKMI